MQQIIVELNQEENVDKFKEAHLTKEKAQYVKAPLIKESPVNIECKVVDVKNVVLMTCSLQMY